MVAPDGGKVARHQQIGRFRHLQRAAQDVAQVHRLVHALARNVGQHRLQGQQVAVDVGNDGELHGVI